MSLKIRSFNSMTALEVELYTPEYEQFIAVGRKRAMLRFMVDSNDIFNPDFNWLEAWYKLFKLKEKL